MVPANRALQVVATKRMDSLAREKNAATHLDTLLIDSSDFLIEFSDRVSKISKTWGLVSFGFSRLFAIY